MSGSLNQVQIIGHLGQDPEERSFQNGGKVVNLRVATSQRWKDRNTGETRERTEWHSVAIFAEGSANYAAQYLRKGSKVYIQGQLETRKWQDQSGQDRYSTEVVVRPYGGQVMGLDRAPQGSGGQHGSDRQGGGGQGGAYSGGGSSGGAGGHGGQDQTRGSYSDMDDEIPF